MPNQNRQIKFSDSTTCTFTTMGMSIPIMETNGQLPGSTMLILTGQESLLTVRLLWDSMENLLMCTCWKDRLLMRGTWISSTQLTMSTFRFLGNSLLCSLSIGMKILRMLGMKYGTGTFQPLVVWFTNKIFCTYLMGRCLTTDFA